MPIDFLVINLALSSLSELELSLSESLSELLEPLELESLSESSESLLSFPDWEGGAGEFRSLTSGIPSLARSLSDVSTGFFRGWLDLVLDVLVEGLAVLVEGLEVLVEGLAVLVEDLGWLVDRALSALAGAFGSAVGFDSDSSELEESESYSEELESSDESEESESELESLESELDPELSELTFSTPVDFVAAIQDSTFWLLD